MDQDDKTILEDIPFTPPPTEEELAAAEQDEQLARRIRREIKRIERGEAAEDIAKDEAEEQAEREQREEEEERERRKQQSRANNIFWQFLSGNILRNSSVVKHYRTLIILSVLLLIDIFVMFWSLHLDMRYNQEFRYVQLLRERSVRMQELRYTRCSHSAISKELERKNSKLQDATHPAVVVKSKGWFNR